MLSFFQFFCNVFFLHFMLVLGREGSSWDEMGV